MRGAAPGGRLRALRYRLVEGVLTGSFYIATAVTLGAAVVAMGGSIATTMIIDHQRRRHGIDGDAIGEQRR